MPTRRCIIKSASTALIFFGWAGASFSAVDEWERWKKKHLHQGRVIDRQNGSITHSEGQAYALLLAQAFGDKPAFMAIENWTSRHLDVRQDSLMAWKWGDRRTNAFIDWHNATDGDLFRAWALLRASRDSGWTEYLPKALRIAHDLSALCLAADPRAQNEFLLIPGAEARRSPTRVLINPSYIMPRALRELGQFTGDIRLVRAANHGETILAELAATDFLPNWTDVAREGFLPPLEHELKWGYDALRIPLYLIWSGNCDHPSLDVSRTYMSRGAIPNHVVVETTSKGEVLAMSNRAGYLAILDLLRHPVGRLPENVDDDYYSSTLRLLSAVAMTESKCLSK